MLFPSRLIRCARVVTRNICTTPVRNDKRSLLKLKKLQSDYQCEDGRPIWLKAGLRDRILYSATILGCIVGLINVFITIFNFAKPASWKQPSQC